MQKVILFGVGQVASTVYWYITHDSPYEVVAFTVDSDYIKEDSLFGLPVRPFERIESFYPPNRYKMLVSISFANMNKLRAEKYHQAKKKGYQLVNYISSNATTWPGLDIGDNCLIQAYSVIGPFVKIGNDVKIMSNTNIGHHSVINDHCTIAPQTVILGNVVVEPHCIIGGNATIRDHVTIARGCVIGAGAVILEDTVEKGIYKGNSPELLSITSDRLKNI